MKKNKAIISFVVTSLLMSGCASFVNHASWPVQIKTIPEGAVFNITNKKGEKVAIGTTPATVYLDGSAGYFKGEIYTLHFTKRGFQEKDATLKASINGWYWGNLANPIGYLIVDPLTGAMFKLPETMTTELAAQVSKIAPWSTELKIISLMDVPTELREQLIVVRQ